MHYWYLVLLFSHQTLEEEVEGYVTVVEALEREAKRLVSGGHFDAANISARQVLINPPFLSLSYPLKYPLHKGEGNSLCSAPPIPTYTGPVG